MKKEDPLAEFDSERHTAALIFNSTSVMVAMREAVAGFRSLTDPAASKTFLYTGNGLNIVRSTAWINFGVSKTAISYAIQTIAESKVYEKEGIS